MLGNTCEQLREKLEELKELKARFNVLLEEAKTLADIEELKKTQTKFENDLESVPFFSFINKFPKQYQENPLRWGEFNFGDNDKNRVEEIKNLKTHLNMHTLEKKILFQIILGVIQSRFEAHTDRHPKIIWENVGKKLKANPEKMLSLCLMELTGGEPDIVDYDEKNNEYTFDDCSVETPKGRRNLVYDQRSEELSKSKSPNEKCNGNAVDMASEIGIEIHDETYYRNHQMGNPCDLKTFSWVKPPNKTEGGVALFGDRSDGVVYVYEGHSDFHIDSRGFRGSLRV